MNYRKIDRVRKIYVRLLSFRILRALYILLFTLISKTLEKAVSKQNNLVVFGASNGMMCADNSKFLFEWMNKNQKDYNYVWLTNNKRIVNSLRGKGYSSCLYRSLQGIKTLFKANIGIYTHSFRDLSIDPWLFPRNIKMIALRHGKSVKGIRYSLRGFKLSDHEAKYRQFETKLIKAVISTSELISKMTEQSLRIGREKIFVTGYPRNDSLFIKSNEDRKRLEEFADIQFFKVILYAPSWRHGRAATRFFPFDDFDLEELIREIEKKKILILCRPHPNDSLRFPEIKTYLSNISDQSKYVKIAGNDVFPDLYSLLPFVDCLITDYSATYHDFLICDRPIWFIPYDYEDYEKQNGFLYDYLKLLPGPNIKSFKRFIKELDDFSNGIDNYQDERRCLKNLIHKYHNGNSSERVGRLIVSTYVKNN